MSKYLQSSKTNRIRRRLALGSTFTILLVTLFLLVVLVVAGNFYPPILNYLSSLHIFEITIIGCLIELLYLQSTRFSEAQQFTVFIKEHDHYADILEEIIKSHPKSVDILSAGLASRYEFIVDLIELGIPVRVLIQGGGVAIDKEDSIRSRSMIDSILHSSTQDAHRYLEIRESTRIVSLRAIIIRHERFNQSSAIVSWYIYSNGGKIIGSRNPAIMVFGTNRDAHPILNFAIKEFNDAWDSSESNVILPAKGDQN